MSDIWKNRLKTASLWLFFAAGALGWIVNGFKGPPPTPPLLQQVAEKQAKIEQDQAETLSRVKSLESGLGVHRIEIK